MAQRFSVGGWVQNYISPEGTAERMAWCIRARESRARVSRPFGTSLSIDAMSPTMNRWAILASSLRDEILAAWDSRRRLQGYFLDVVLSASHLMSWLLD